MPVLPNNVGRLWSGRELNICTHQVLNLKPIVIRLSIASSQPRYFLAISQSLIVTVIGFESNESAHWSCQNIVIVWIFYHFCKLWVILFNFFPLAICDGSSSLLKYLDDFIVVVSELDISHFDFLHVIKLNSSKLFPPLFLLFACVHAVLSSIDEWICQNSVDFWSKVLL